ncbi:Wall-associated receptor kinase, galacturonan-binding domain [Dillenia turbinata]|uniref:Wall-associated receptor kinase, galacturonan-binding domain n=1 Tax=Dillenia turbinata TaxID=194707 RepID=A0AAN8UZR8_9MAGN
MCKRVLLIGILIVAVPILLQFPETSDAKVCHPSSCGNLKNISYPFRLKGDPKRCGKHELSCENNLTVMYLLSGKYYVQAIEYGKKAVRMVDAGLKEDNCSWIPQYPLEVFNLSGDSFFYTDLATSLIFVRCPDAMVRFPHNGVIRYPHDGVIVGYPTDGAIVDTSNWTRTSCVDVKTDQERSWHYSYAMFGVPLSDMGDSCWIESVSLVDSSSFPWLYNMSSLEFRNWLLSGFDLSWWSWIDGYVTPCGDCTFECSYDRVLYCYYIVIKGTSSYEDPGCGKCAGVAARFFATYILFYGGIGIGFMLGGRAICAMPLVFAFLLRKWRRRHLSGFEAIEDFIQGHNNLMPIRYSYSHIKKMTKAFSDKLGEGGYGSVFKGKLRSGHLVAVKMLGKSTTSGQDFISEMATIGRIHHVNVVQLVGFCVEGSKRALVYDFMPNGSLEKYIFPVEKGNNVLSCEKIFEIALGVAQGMEYLHRGCDMQILHFDIKPHNILLDKDFTPKISDFGLARLYPAHDSTISLTAARGTLGYMAPEFFYKNVGGVSSKADVYSFGMLLMEIAGRRKNLNAYAEHLSQIYFPSWVYDKLSEGKEIVIEEATEEDKEIVKKMVLVALWCIQMKPTDRPSMSEVVEMLEGEVELHLPPKPFLGAQNIPDEEHCESSTNAKEASIPVSNSTVSIILDPIDI